MPASGRATERSPADGRSRAPSPARSRRAPWVGAEPPVGQVVLAAAAASAVFALGEVVLRGHIGLLLGLGFIVVCVAAALTVRSTDLFTAGVLPPLLMLALLVTLAVVDRSTIGVRALQPEASTLQVVIAGFVDQAGAMVVAHLLALVVVGMRVRAGRRRRLRTSNRGA